MSHRQRDNLGPLQLSSWSGDVCDSPHGSYNDVQPCWCDVELLFFHLLDQADQQKCRELLLHEPQDQPPFQPLSKTDKCFIFFFKKTEMGNKISKTLQFSTQTTAFNFDSLYRLCHKDFTAAAQGIRSLLQANYLDKEEMLTKAILQNVCFSTNAHSMDILHKPHKVLSSFLRLGEWCFIWKRGNQLHGEADFISVLAGDVNWQWLSPSGSLCKIMWVFSWRNKMKVPIFQHADWLWICGVPNNGNRHHMSGNKFIYIDRYLPVQNYWWQVPR